MINDFHIRCPHKSWTDTIIVTPEVARSFAEGGHETAAGEALLAAAKAGLTINVVTYPAGFYRVMSRYRLGKTDEARTVANESAAKMKPLPNSSLDDFYRREVLYVWLAYKEAKAMIKFDEAPPPEAKGNQN